MSSEHARFAERQLRQFERQLAEHGRGLVEKSRAALARRLADHLQKLEAIRQAGGHVSSVEREIRNLQQQLAALDDILRREA